MNSQGKTRVLTATHHTLSLIVIGAAVLLVSLVITLGNARIARADPSAEGISTLANTEDAWFSFPLSEHGTWGTDGRLKTDASSTYINPTTMQMRTCRVYVDAWTGSGWNNQTVYGYATVPSTGKWRIRQNVFENYGTTNARLSAWANNGGGVLAGYWSPDSWGSYTAINGG